LKFGLPVILGVEFKNKQLINLLISKAKRKKRNKSTYHAITITGYQDIDDNDLDQYFNRILSFLKRVSVKRTEIKKDSSEANHFDIDFNGSESEINIKGEMISKFYAHDDQIGPFSRLHFLSKKKIRTSWWDNKNFFNVEKKEIGYFHSVIIPLPQDFKIYYANVREQIAFLNGLLVKFFDYSTDSYWNIYLQKSNTYKTKIINGKRDTRLPRDLVLFESLPKYIWIAEMYSEGEHTLDYLLDPTEINNNSSGLHFRYYDYDVYKEDSDHIKLYKSSFIRLFENRILSSQNRKDKKYTLSILNIFKKLSLYLEENSISL
jgi:hypothetical protein